jgi:hypothetical protein
VPLLRWQTRANTPLFSEKFSSSKSNEMAHRWGIQHVNRSSYLDNCKQHWAYWHQTGRDGGSAVAEAASCSNGRLHGIFMIHNQINPSNIHPLYLLVLMWVWG